ncbi:hypothetical protein [Sinobacterium norvegicum]|nr:hypothetical protein [Sinobacterium norvegicum]
MTSCISAALLVGSPSFAQQPVTPSTGISILSVDNNADNTVTINGKAGPWQAITDLTINGYQPLNYIPQSDPSITGPEAHIFSLTIPAADHYQIVSYDMLQGTRSADYASADTAIENAVQLAISDQFMAEVGPVVETLLEDISLTSLLDIDSNECIYRQYSWQRCGLYLREAGINGRPDVSVFFTPASNNELTINVAIHIPEAALHTRVKRPFWWGYRNTRIAAKNVDVFAQIGVTATDNQSIKLILDDPSDIALHIGKLDVDSNTIAANMIPLFKNSITTIINKHLVNVVGPILNHVALPEIPLSLPLDIDGDGNNDAVFDIAMHANQLSADNNNTGIVAIGGAISVSEENTAQGREILGYRVIEGELPNADLANNTDIQASLAVSFVNQIVAALYQSGLEESIAIPLKVSDLGSFGEALGIFGYAIDAPMNFEIAFGGLPEITLSNDAVNPLGLQLVAPELRFKMIIENAAGEMETALDFEMDVAVATSIGAHADGKLDLDFNDILAMNITTLYPSTISDLGGPQTAPLITFGLQMMLQEFAPLVEDLTNSARIDLDLGALLNDLLKTNDFSTIPATGYITEADASDDNAYMTIGIGVDFN